MIDGHPIIMQLARRDVMLTADALHDGVNGRILRFPLHAAQFIAMRRQEVL